MAVCEFAVPADVGTVGKNASKTTINPRYKVELFAIRGAACQLKRFSDGADLRVERQENSDPDYACVGPDDPTCPKRRGFELVQLTSTQELISDDGTSTLREISGDVTRRIR